MTTHCQVAALRGDRVWVLVVVLGAGFAFNLSLTVLTIALPILATTFDVTDSLSAWVTVGPMLASAVFTPVAGKLSDVYGARAVWTVGTTLTIISIVLCGAAQSFWALLAGRLLGGAGLAANAPASMALLVDAYPRSRRAEPVGYWTAALTVAPTLGVVLGGVLLQSLSWRFLFWIQLPPALASLALSFVVFGKWRCHEAEQRGERDGQELQDRCPLETTASVERSASTDSGGSGPPRGVEARASEGVEECSSRSRDQRAHAGALPPAAAIAAAPSRKLDVAGTVLLSVATMALLMAVNQGPDIGWKSVPVVAAGALAIFSLTALVFVERRVEFPLVPAVLFRDAPLLLAVSCRMCFNFAYMGSFIIAPFMLKQVFALAPSHIAMLLFTRPLAMSVTAMTMPRIARRFGLPNGALVVAGGVLLTIALMGLIGFVRQHASLALAVVSFVTQGVGLGLTSPTTTTIVTLQSPPNVLGVVLGLLSMMVTVAMSTGMVLMLAVVMVTGGANDASAYVSALEVGVMVTVATTGLALALHMKLRRADAQGPTRTHGRMAGGTTAATRADEERGEAALLAHVDEGHAGDSDGARDGDDGDDADQRA